MQWFLLVHHTHVFVDVLSGSVRRTDSCDSRMSRSIEAASKTAVSTPRAAAVKSRAKPPAPPAAGPDSPSPSPDKKFPKKSPKGVQEELEELKKAVHANPNPE